MELFGTAGIRGPVEHRTTPQLAVAVGLAAAVDGDEWVVGRDGRLSGYALVDAVSAGLKAGGADVINVGSLSTPALAFASRDRHGIMVTASHNPPSDNGLKLFIDGTEYDSKREAAIERRIKAGPSPTSWSEWRSSREMTVTDDYRRAVITYATAMVSDATGVTVAIDGGGGMGSLMSPPVLDELGARVHALNCHIDPEFSARPSKPTADTIQELSAYVSEAESMDFGVAHDGDGDRLVVVNGSGKVVHEDTILAVLAGFFVETTEVNDPVVITTPNASGRIDERVESLGGRVIRGPLGGLHETRAAVEAASSPGTDVVFAAEPWKHIHPAFGPWIDATASVAILAGLVADVGGIEELLEPITERPYRKVNVGCPDDRKTQVMGALSRELPAQFPDATLDDSYGIRLDWPTGSWVLVRPSGTEPFIRIYVEGEDVEALITETRSVVESTVAGDKSSE